MGSPGKMGFPFKSSPNMQPLDHMSTPNVYLWFMFKKSFIKFIKKEKKEKKKPSLEMEIKEWNPTFGYPIHNH